MQSALFGNNTSRPNPAKMEIRVLMIEDDAVDSKWIQKKLQDYFRAQFLVSVANKLDAALAHLDKTFFDAVLLDLNLPDSHGGETLLRTLMHSTAVPLVIFSGNRDHHLLQGALQRGVYAYLIKSPEDLERLPDILHDAVLERRLRQADQANRRLSGQ